jgi:hypothetical protein
MGGVESGRAIEMRRIILTMTWVIRGNWTQRTGMEDASNPHPLL